MHRGHVVAVDLAGKIRTASGKPGLRVYPRSALKPFQALAVIRMLFRAGAPPLDSRAVAIASASHAGAASQQDEAARLLALAGLDESALRCPPALPVQPQDVVHQREARRLAHNCSGKHAAFLLAQRLVGAAPEAYLEPQAAVQREVATTIEAVTGTRPTGPGVDGCGAPAWRLPLQALALGFARLAEGAEDLGVVREAMRAHPELVGGADAVDTALMQADERVIAKRGAEGVLAAALTTPAGPVGVAVKVADGGARATGPAVGAVLRALGAAVPQALLRPAVLGGGRPRGFLRVRELR